MKQLFIWLMLFSGAANAQTIIRNESLDLYRSKNSSAPVVIFIHGGAWISGDKQEYENLGKAFQKSLNMAIINYRLSPAVKHPAHIDDLKKAIKDLRKEFTNQKFFLMGHSAGAYMAAYLATQGEEKIDGFIGLSGIYDLTSLAKKWPSYPNWFLNQAFGKDEKNSWKKISPSQMDLKSKSPWLIVHSSSDELVDLGQSEEFLKHLKKQKIPAELVKLPRLSHFGIFSDLANEKSELHARVLKFMSPL